MAAVTDTRSCWICKVEKPIDSFRPWLSKDGRRGYERSCIDCSRERSRLNARKYLNNNKLSILKKRRAEYRESEEFRTKIRDRQLRSNYGISLADYDALLRSQGGACAICKTPYPGKKGTFHVDHCHRTGEVRGLLCSNCNTGIGLLNDDIDRLLAAVEYLQHARDFQGSAGNGSS